MLVVMDAVDAVKRYLRSWFVLISMHEALWFDLDEVELED